MCLVSKSLEKCLESRQFSNKILQFRIFQYHFFLIKTQLLLRIRRTKSNSNQYQRKKSLRHRCGKLKIIWYVSSVFPSNHKSICCRARIRQKIKKKYNNKVKAEGLKNWFDGKNAPCKTQDIIYFFHEYFPIYIIRFYFHNSGEHIFFCICDLLFFSIITFFCRSQRAR